MKKQKDLNFKVNDSFGYHFKLAAARKGYKLKQLLEEAFDQWLRLNDIEMWRAYQEEQYKQKRKRDKMEEKSKDSDKDNE